MIVYGAILVTGLWNLYNFVSYIFNLPYICIGGTNSILRTLNIVALKWSIVFGLLLTIYSIAGFIFCKKENNTLDQMRIPLLVLGVVSSVLLVF